jgi:hypothetical protein
MDTAQFQHWFCIDRDRLIVRLSRELPFASVALIGLVACSPDPAPSADALTDASLVEHLSSTGRMSHSMARAPVGAFLLARSNQDYCAIAFTQFSESKADTAPTVFSDGAPSRYASYEVAIAGADKRGFAFDSSEKRTGYVNSHSSTGIGRVAFARGDYLVDCGKFQLAWEYPVWVRFYPTEGAEFAITRIRDLSQLNIDAPELKWYGLDQTGNRESIEQGIESYCCETKVIAR